MLLANTGDHVRSRTANLVPFFKKIYIVTDLYSLQTFGLTPPGSLARGDGFWSSQLSKPNSVWFNAGDSVLSFFL